MRVFKDINIKQSIAREMINIEAGLLYFEPGKNMNTNPPLYPVIERDNIKTTIKTHVGFIYLPDIDMNDFMKGVEPYLAEYDSELKHLHKYARLERLNGQFTAMKAKNNMVYTKYKIANKGEPDIYTKRVIHINSVLNSFHNSMIYRFRWYVFNTKTMIKNVEQFENPMFPTTTQFVSILYDKNDYLTVPNGYKLESNITFQHFKIFQNLISFNPLQEIVDKELAAIVDYSQGYTLTDTEKQQFINSLQCPNCRKTFKAKIGLSKHMKLNTCKKVNSVADQAAVENDSLTSLLPGPAPFPLVNPTVQLAQTNTEMTHKNCPFCNKSFKTTGSLKTHMKKCKNVSSETQNLAKATIQKDNMMKFIQMTPDEKQKHLDQISGHPEYIPQWNDNMYDPMHSIALCSKRGAVFELIRYFGFWNKYDTLFNKGVIPLHKLIKPLYYEEFHNIIIENKIPKTRKLMFPNTKAYLDSEICISCFTPLYGDIYVICDETNTGMAVCPTCMHYEPFQYSPKKPTQQLLRVAYPTTVASLINKTNFTPLKKKILLQSFGSTFVDSSYGAFSAFYLEYSSGINGIEYLGWTGFLSDFINYLDSNNKFSQINKQPMMKFLEKTKIFPAKLISY